MSLILAMLLVSAQAPDAQQPAAAAAPTAAPKKIKVKKICRIEDPESGSHMSKRVCRTASEWDLVDQGVNLSDKQIQTDLPEQH